MKSFFCFSTVRIIVPYIFAQAMTNVFVIYVIYFDKQINLVVIFLMWFHDFSNVAALWKSVKQATHFMWLLFTFTTHAPWFTHRGLSHVRQAEQKCSVSPAASCGEQVGQTIVTWRKCRKCLKRNQPYLSAILVGKVIKSRKMCTVSQGLEFVRQTIRGQDSKDPGI